MTENSLIFKYLSPQCSDFQIIVPTPHNKGGIWGGMDKNLEDPSIGAEIFKNQIILRHIFAWPPFTIGAKNPEVGNDLALLFQTESFR